MQELYYTGNTTKLYLKAIYGGSHVIFRVALNLTCMQSSIKKGILSQLINKQTINFRMRHNREKVKIC